MPQDGEETIESTESASSYAPNGLVSAVQGTGSNAGAAHKLARSVIATELGIGEDALKDDTNLAEIGCDSLMSLLILGTLTNELGMDLPPSLFIECNTLQELRQFFVSAYSESDHELSPPSNARPPNIPSGDYAPPVTHTQQELNAATAANLIRGVRVQQPTLLQKSERGPNLFLFPDGSGAAAAYSALPDLKSCSLYGLNSPFMADPSKWQGGVLQLALAYIASIRMVQPRGPYMIG
jgi:acyl carrier protein